MGRGLNISINNTCNNNCSYCFQSLYNNTAEKKYISLEHYEKILTFLKDSPIEHINILGGEPTLHPQLLDIIDLTTKYDFSYLLITNLLVEDENFFKKILDKKPKILINGTHYNNTKELFEKNLKYFYETTEKNFYNHAISFCLTGNKNEDENTICYIQYLCERFKDYKLHFRISPAAPNGKIFNLINFSEQYKRISNILQKYGFTFNFDCTLNQCQIDYSLLDNILLDKREMEHIQEHFSTHCDGALDILLDDKLYFCNSLRDFGVPIFEYQNFDEAYAALTVKISQMINGSPYQYCDLECQKRNYCIGPCPAQIYALKKQKEINK